MPELPEVETFVRTLRPRLTGRRIAAIAIAWPRQVRPEPGALARAIAGQTIAAVLRRGKLVVLSLGDGSALLLHLKMSGRLLWEADCSQPPPHVRVRLALDGGDALLFDDARKFGRVVHVRDPAAALAGLGPEPLDPRFTARAFADRLRSRRRRLKPLLLDQAFLAGVGNIYSDEALHRAGLHPLRKSDSLSPAEAARLLGALRRVLREAIRLQGTTFDWVYPGGGMQARLRVYGRTGEPCLRCAEPIVRLVVGQRSAHFCPRCQPLGSLRRQSGDSGNR